MNKITKNDIGLIIDQSHGDTDRLNARIVSLAMNYGFQVDEAGTKLLARYQHEVMKEDDSEYLNEFADEAVNHLNGLELPAYCSFIVDDNSLFLSPNLEDVKESVEFVSTRTQDEPDSDYRGEWLHVNDRGNCTLYARDAQGIDNEIWSIV